MITLSRVISDINRLPTLPISLARILELRQDGESGLEDFEKAIRPDPALTATVLRLANSAYFGCPRQVTSLRQAAAVLGTRRLVEAAVGGALSRLVPDVLPGYGIDAVSFFRHSVAVAVISERMGEELGLGDSRGLFTCGLLHDVGKLVVSDYLAKERAAVTEMVRERGMTFVDAELDLLGLDHTEVGAEMAERWRLPVMVYAAVKWHHRPREVKMDTVDVIHVADGLAHAMGYGADLGELARRLDPGAHARIGASIDKLEQVVSETAVEIEAMAAAFRGDTGGETCPTKS